VAADLTLPPIVPGSPTAAYLVWHHRKWRSSLYEYVCPGCRLPFSIEKGTPLIQQSPVCAQCGLARRGARHRVCQRSIIQSINQSIWRYEQFTNIPLTHTLVGSSGRISNTRQEAVLSAQCLGTLHGSNITRKTANDQTDHASGAASQHCSKQRIHLWAITILLHQRGPGFGDFEQQTKQTKQTKEQQEPASCACPPFPQWRVPIFGRKTVS
jgi:hypothetical protein